MADAAQTRFVIVVSPEPLPQSLEPCVWPVHVTVAPVFSARGNSRPALHELLRATVREVPAFEIVLGGPARFGPDADLPVLLTSHSLLDLIHARLASRLETLDGFRPETITHWGIGYRAHVTIGPLAPVEPLDTITLGAISTYAHRGRSWDLISVELLSR